MQMPYNFRNRSIPDAVLEEEDVGTFFGDDASGDEDFVFEESEHSEYSSESENSFTDEEMEQDWEDPSLQQRLENSRAKARGRPITKVRGKNGYAWSTNCPQRLSGRQDSVCISMLLMYETFVYFNSNNMLQVMSI